MEFWIEIVITVFTAAIASSGLWAFLSTKTQSKSAEAELLIGLAHDRIMCLGASYIERGWISTDEYENLQKYLYEPYIKLGGNGSAKRIMEEVNNLPIGHKGD